MWSPNSLRQVFQSRHQALPHGRVSPRRETYRHLAFEELESRRLLTETNVSPASNNGATGLEQQFSPAAPGVVSADPAINTGDMGLGPLSLAPTGVTSTTPAINVSDTAFGQLFLEQTGLAATPVNQAAFPVNDTLPNDFVRDPSIPAAGTPHNPLQLEAGGGGFPTGPEAQPLPAAEPDVPSVAISVQLEALDTVLAAFQAPPEPHQALDVALAEFQVAPEPHHASDASQEPDDSTDAENEHLSDQASQSAAQPWDAAAESMGEEAVLLAAY